MHITTSERERAFDKIEMRTAEDVALHLDDSVSGSVHALHGDFDEFVVRIISSAQQVRHAIMSHHISRGGVHL